MKYLKYAYIILIIVMTIGVIFAINKFEPVILESKKIVEESEGEDIQNTQISSREEVAEETYQILDITDKLKEHWYSGIITKIDGNTIYFHSDDYKRDYILTLQDTYKYVSLRTGVDISFKDIKEGYYFDTFSYYMNDIFGVASNISGEALRKELLQNLALGEANAAGTVASPGIKNIDIINSNKALITVEIKDMYCEPLGNEEVFEFTFLLDANTDINSKGGGAHSIETLNNAAHDIVDIYLDENTLNDKTPLVTAFYSSDS